MGSTVNHFNMWLYFVVGNSMGQSNRDCGHFLYCAHSEYVIFCCLHHVDLPTHFSKQISGYAGKLSALSRFKTALQTDERVRFMSEIISGIQMIKMYAWEKPFERLITEIRRLELNAILKNSNIHAFNLTLALVFNKIPLFCTVSSFVLLYGSENFSVSKMFMTMYLINGISFLMCHIFIRGVSEVGDVLVALKRLQVFLEYEEKGDFTSASSKLIDFDQLESEDLAVLMKNVSVEWNISAPSQLYLKSENANDKLMKPNATECKPFTLRNINLRIPKGKLILVVGEVGSGKSTLIHMLLKELPINDGSIGINGTISYTSQDSWIFNSTIRQNITFGRPMHQLRYDRIVRCVDLFKDFKQFNEGDLTFVGENGAGLSGGQKSRIKYLYSPT